MSSAPGDLSFIWVFLILIFPLMSSLIYVITELIPERERNNTIQRWAMNFERLFMELFPKL